MFSIVELLFISLVFLWTGFVRTGIGFGGAVFGLPLALLIGGSALYWLPIISIHLLFFASLSLTTALKKVDWSFLKKSLLWIIPTKIIGILGLLNLPDNIMSIFVFIITLIYSIYWILAKTIKSGNKILDKFFLMLGGYVSGSTLTGAPLIVAVYTNNIKKSELRNTLFVLWIILVSMKMSAFLAVGVKVDWQFALMLIPAAAIGHYLGLKIHNKLISHDKFFKRAIGCVLALICFIGLFKILILS